MDIWENCLKRISLNLEKTHYNDAFCIAGGTNQIRIASSYILNKLEETIVHGKNFKMQHILT